MNMQRLNIIILVLLMPFYVSNVVNIPVEDTTDPVDMYDPNSDETFDPQKDYADFKSSYEKLYRMSGPSFVLPSAIQQNPWQSFHIPNDEINENAEESTNPSDLEQETSDQTTTIPPQIEQQTTQKSFTENAAMRSINDVIKSTQRPIELASYEQSAPNAELLMRKPFDTTNDNKSDEDFINDMGMAVQQQAPVVFIQNESSIHNESADYVNDEAIETNNSQPITSIPYLMDTTITSLPSSPVFISTRSPLNLFSTSTLSSTVASAAAISTAPQNGLPSNPSSSSSSVKKSKKIEVLPRVYKYSADEIVRKYLDDSFLRAPLATLINTAPEPLRKAKILWKSALRPNTPIDIVLVAFNSSGVGVTYSFKNTRTMIAGLESVQESREMLEGGSGFYGILRASELIPYDSAIFISTDKIPQDISLMKNAASILLKKRIRLYLIWFGDQDIDENETSTGGVLGEVALRSGGEILRITEESLGNGDMGLVTHFLQNDIQGAQVLEIPVNTTDTNLHIKIQGSVDQATITTPIGGKIINLLNIDSVASFSINSRAIYIQTYNETDPETIINLYVTDSPKGIYTLRIIPETTTIGTYVKYNLIVNREYDHRRAKNNIQTLSGEVAFNEKHIPRSKRSEQLSEANDDDNKVVWPENQTDNQFDEQQFIVNNDTEVLSRNGKNTLYSITKIDLGAQSQLLANPGATVQIHYEITNLGNLRTLHYFMVRDEQSFLRGFNPYTPVWIAPGQTQNIIVELVIPPNVEVGRKNKITLQAQTTNSFATQSAVLTVTSPQTTALDRRAPTIHWRYGSRCWGHTDAGRCAGAVWSMEITTVDYDTGILRVQSNPKGLLFRDRYTAGTTDEVKATYSASCCSPRVTITSYDLAGNQRTISLDVTDIYLEPMEIVAIVLGVILLILIIIAIIVAIVYCCKKRRNSRELPVYRSRAERERST